MTETTRMYRTVPTKLGKLRNFTSDTIFQRVTSIADRLNIDFALIHKERKKANEVRE